MGWGIANKILELYLSSYQIWIKSIKCSGKYKLLKNFNINVDAGTGLVHNFVQAS